MSTKQISQPIRPPVVRRIALILRKAEEVILGTLGLLHVVNADLRRMHAIIWVSHVSRARCDAKEGFPGNEPGRDESAHRAVIEIVSDSKFREILSPDD